MLSLRFVPKLETMNLPTVQLRHLIEQLHARRTSFNEAGLNVQETITRLLLTWTCALDLSPAPSATSSQFRSANGASTVTDALELCCTVRAPEACKRIMTRLLNPPTLDATYVKVRLAPLVSELRAFMLKHRDAATAALIAPALQAIMLLWAQKVLGPRPANSDTAATWIQALQKWTCTCDICKVVRTFLASGVEGKKNWPRIGAQKRQHVEKYLRTHAQPIATWETILTTPQGLMVGLPSYVYVHDRS